jgi:HAD superfamily hydrolase (TIGR01548 family)
MRLVIFDMDGVLVDPTESFRRTVLEVVRRFTDAETTFERIVEIKNEGGYNDDADVALRIIKEMGRTATREDVARCGREVFWGANGDGLLLNERWLVEDGLLERLASDGGLAIFTGRGRQTAHFSLDRHCPHIRFEAVMTSDQIENLKPAPDGLLKILETRPDADPVFVGDNVDDARSARAAGVPFVGIADAALHRRDETVELFMAEGARAVIESVNDLERWV